MRANGWMGKLFRRQRQPALPFHLAIMDGKYAVAIDDVIAERIPTTNTIAKVEQELGGLMACP